MLVAMTLTNDLDLLEKFTRDQSQDAFTALVRRHLNLVYCAALRQVRSPQLAEEVAQSVFTDLARNAGRLKPDTILTAWLYQVTRRTAIDVVRGEVRRQLREQIAFEMNAMNAKADDWMQIEPLLDEAMHALDATDRTAVLLRYFENKSLREVGETLGTTDDTARKRVNRAVERLREFFAKRGIIVGATGLAVVISANAVQAAPVGLVLTISTAAVLSGTTIAGTATATATNAIAMTTAQKVIITTVLTAAIGTGIYEARQASTLRTQVQTLQRQQTPLVEQIQQLSQDRDEAVRQLAALPGQLARKDDVELLRLRNQVGLLREQIGLLKAGRENGTTAAVPDAGSSSNALLAYLGEAVPPPANIDPAYSKEGLLGAIQQAAQLAGVSLKRVEIETSEFPFLAGVVCDGDADFEKLKAQLKNMPAYEYAGSAGSDGISAFNITPYRSFPSETGQRIRRRTSLRTQMFFDQLAAH